MKTERDLAVNQNIYERLRKREQLSFEKRKRKAKTMKCCIRKPNIQQQGSTVNNYLNSGLSFTYSANNVKILATNRENRRWSNNHKRRSIRQRHNPQMKSMKDPTHPFCTTNRGPYWRNDIRRNIFLTYFNKSVGNTFNFRKWGEHKWFVILRRSLITMLNGL